MISRVIKKTIDLNRIQKVDQLEGPLYQLEDGGHTFEITCLMDGAAAAVSGTVSARFLRDDEITVYFTGTLSGNVASVTLPQSCYNVNGRFGMVIFVSGDDITTAVYAVAGSVYRSTSDTIIDPTEEIPSLEELIAQIEACEDATDAANAAAAFVPNTIASAYSTSKTYAVGDYVTYNGNMYCCKTAIDTAESWTSAHWTQVTSGGEISTINNNIKGAGAYDIAYGVGAIDGDRHILDFSIGGYNYNNNKVTWTNATTRIHPQCIRVVDGDVLTIKNGTGFQNSFRTFTGTPDYCTSRGSATSFTTSNVTYNVTFDGFIVVLFADSTDTSADVSLADFSGSVTVESYAKNKIAGLLPPYMLSFNFAYADEVGASVLGSFVDGYIDSAHNGSVVINDTHTRATYPGLIYAKGDIKFVTNPGYQVTIATYNSDGSFIGVTGWVNGYILPNGSIFRFSIRQYKNSTFTSIGDLVDQVTLCKNVSYPSKNIAIPFVLNDGYIGTDGMTNAGETTHYQLYTTKINVREYDDLIVSLKYTESRVMWLAYAEYTETGAIIQRTVLSASDSTARDKYISNIDLSDNAYYVAFTFWSYGENNFSFNVYNGNLIPWNDLIYAVNHRGYSKLAPENTLSAFRLSKEKGFKYVETDVRFTSDSVPVLLHNTTIDATSNGTGSVSQMTYEQLLQYDFGSWKSSKYAGEKIPTFDQFMHLCKQLGLIPFVELKSNPDQSLVEMLVGIAKKYRMENDVFWYADSKSVVLRVLECIPDANVGLSVGELSQSVIEDAADIKSTYHNTVFVGASTGITDALLTLIAQNGLLLDQWIINNYSSAVSQYADIIVTNNLPMWKVLYILGMA